MARDQRTVNGICCDEYMGILESAEPLAYETAFWSLALENPDFPVDKLGGVALEVAAKLRALAIVLLLTGDTEAFYHNLSRSGRAWLRFLNAARHNCSEEDHHYASGRYAPLIDSIAAGDLETAVSVAERSPGHWREGHEYEDDYCFGRLLQVIVSGKDDHDVAEELLARYETYVGTESNPRPQLCRAILKRDQQLFDESFDEFLGLRTDQIESDMARGEIESTLVTANRTVFVDGLAILRLAGTSGLQLESEYLYCPGFARSVPKSPFPRG